MIHAARSALWWKVALAIASWPNQQPLAKWSAIVLKGKARLTFYHLSSAVLFSNNVEQKWNKLWRCAPVIDHYKCGHDCRINFEHREVPDTWSKMTPPHCRRTEFAVLSKSLCRGRNEKFPVSPARKATLQTCHLKLNGK